MKRINSLSPSFVQAYLDNQSSVVKELLEVYFRRNLEVPDNQSVANCHEKITTKHN